MKSFFFKLWFAMLSIVDQNTLFQYGFCHNIIWHFYSIMLKVTSVTCILRTTYRYQCIQYLGNLYALMCTEKISHKHWNAYIITCAYHMNTQDREQSLSLSLIYGSNSAYHIGITGITLITCFLCLKYFQRKLFQLIRVPLPIQKYLSAF